MKTVISIFLMLALCAGCSDGDDNPTTPNAGITEPMQVTTGGGGSPNWLNNSTITFFKDYDLYRSDIFSGNTELLLDLQPITVGGVDVSLSRDGSELAYNVLRDPRGFFLLIIIDMATGEETQITPYGSSYYGPEFSFDGNSIICTRGGTGVVVFERGPEGYWTERTLIAGSSTHRTQPTFSPSGNKIAYRYDGNIWTANSDGSNQTALTNHGEVAGNLDWSPDGSFIAYSYGGAVKAVSVADGSIRTIVDEDESLYSLRLSPNGEAIAVSRRIDNVSNVWVYPVN